MKSQDPDHQLVQKAKQGDEKAFESLVKKYRDQVLFLAYDLVGNYEEAKEVAQDVFIRSYDKLSRFEGRARFSTWLYRMTVNMSVDYQRRAKRASSPHFRSLKGADSAMSLSGREGDFSPHTLLERDELTIQIEKAMQGLSANQRAAIVLKYFHGKKTDEIATMMQCDQATVRVHLLRALTKLRKFFRMLEEK